MRTSALIACLCLASPIPCAAAQNCDSGSNARHAVEPINTKCPIGKEPIMLSAGTVEHKGKSVGFCCPGCGRQFQAWNEARKDAFVAMSVASHESGTNRHGQTADEVATGEASTGPSYPFTLPDCPIGGRLGSMGDPVVRVYDNREVRFCCAGCIGEFESNQGKYWGKIDEKIVEQQLMHYPIDICIVTSEKLGADTVNHIHDNRLVRLANAAAVAAFKVDPTKRLKALDEAIIDAQLPGYPMDNCPVGGPLGSMGEPVNFIYMNRLVRFCCAGCEKSLINEPAKYMAKLDAAYADRQRQAYPVDTCVVSGAKLGSMGEPVELVAGTTLVRFCCEGCLPRFRASPGEFLAELRQE